jgi:hypothetical protein
MNLTNITPSMAALDSLLTDALRMALSTHSLPRHFGFAAQRKKASLFCRGARNDEWMGGG